jgi:hypothetical protein
MSEHLKLRRMIEESDKRFDEHYAAMQRPARGDNAVWWLMAGAVTFLASAALTWGAIAGAGLVKLLKGACS